MRKESASVSNVSRDSTYRRHFAAKERAADYDEVQYASGSYSDVLWEVEKRQLQDIIASLRSTHERIDYLDFAAGTGRIISFVEDQVDTATGIEISSAMVERAQAKLSRARMICADITGTQSAVEDSYDLITAFRFVLNAEPALRLAAMKALAARLKDERSVIVFNNHGNIWSLKLLALPFHKLRSRRSGWKPEGNVMSDTQVRELAEQAGLRIVRQLGCGVLSGKSLKLLGRERTVRMERALAARPVLWRLGANRMYVAQLASAAG
jgi:hypothetical protein